MYHNLSILFLAAKDYMLPCLNKQMFGIDCPGCGIQRAAFLLYKGEFLAAFEMYPAIYTLVLLLFFLGADLLIRFKFAFQIKLFLLLLNVVIIVGSYVLKMNNLLH